MNDLLVYVLESFFDSRQEKLDQLSTPEKLKSKDVIDYIRSNMKGSKLKQGAFLREGPLYFLNAMVKEGGALDRGKPGTSAPGYAFVGGKRAYGRVSGDEPLRKVERPLIVPEVDFPGVPVERIQDVVISEALTLFRAWVNRNKPRFFNYNSAKPLSGEADGVEELFKIYRSHTEKFKRLHDLILENNNATPIYLSKTKGKLPIGKEGERTGITIDRPGDAAWICLKLRIKTGATWTMYSNSVGKLGSMLVREGIPAMVSTYGNYWDLWLSLPAKLTMPEVYDLVGGISGVERVGKAAKGVGYRAFLMDSVLIDESTFTDNRCIFPLSLHIHHGAEKVATKQTGSGNQDFKIDSGLSMVPAKGSLPQFDMGIDNHPLQAMYDAPDHLARLYRYARLVELIPELGTGIPMIEIDNDASNLARDYFTSLRQMDKDEFWEGELKEIPDGRDVTLVYDGVKGYIKGLPGGKAITNLVHTDEFEQLCTKPTTAYARIQGKDANALIAFLSQIDAGDFDQRRVQESFATRTIVIWGVKNDYNQIVINNLSGRFVRSTKRAKPDVLEEMLTFAPNGLIGTVSPSEGVGEEKIIFQKESTPVLVLGYEKDSVINNEARVLIVGKVVKEKVDVLTRGKIKPTKKAGVQSRDEYQEVARVGAFSGFSYEDRRDLYLYMESLNFKREYEGDILIDPVEANIILQMEHKGLLADKPMWRYNRKASNKEIDVAQGLPGGGERRVKGVRTKFSMEPLSKYNMPQYNNPKIIGYRSEMGRDEQRIYPYLIPTSDVTYGVTTKNNPPITLSKYTNYKEKKDSPFYAVLGFKTRDFAKEDLNEFRKRMKSKFGESTIVVQSGMALVAHKKGAKIGETCENCGAPKSFSPPATITQERAADEGPAVRFMCDVCGRQTYQRDRRNPPLGHQGWNVIFDFPKGEYAFEMKQIQNAFDKMKEWFPGANFEWDEIIQGKSGIKDYSGVGKEMMKIGQKIGKMTDMFEKRRNTLIITKGTYKRNYFGYTSSVNPTPEQPTALRFWLFSLPHLQNNDEEMNLITLCHEIGHALFPTRLYGEEYTTYEGQTPNKGRFDNTGHCKDYDCAMSLGSYKMNAFKDQLKREGRHDNINMFCELCRAQMGLFNTGIITKKNPLVSVEEQKDKGDLKAAQKIMGYDKNNELTPEVEPYLHTNWPSWYRRTERDLIVRGLGHLDYVGVIDGFVNKTGSSYYNSMYNIAKRNKGKPLIRNRKQHQELAILYSMCHNDLDLIVTWPNATSSPKVEDFEDELEKSSTIVYSKEVKLTRKAAEVLCMQMYIGESFLSKEQVKKKALASGWEKLDDNDTEKTLHIYLIHNQSDKSLRGQGAPRKEQLRSIFKSSANDRKSYIHTADNPVQVTEYAQIFFNENSLELLSNNDINLLLPKKPTEEWLMINSVKKYIQQEFGSLFLACTTIKSGSAAYLHGIRRTHDIDLMIDDRRLGSDTRQKMELLKKLMPWCDYSLAYTMRGAEKFFDYETFVPGKTFYHKRSEMTHNPEYHAYFCGLKVETARSFMWSRKTRVSEQARPRATGDLLMFPIFWDEGRFRKLEKEWSLPWYMSIASRTINIRYEGKLTSYLQTVKWWMKTRYERDIPKDTIKEMIKRFREKEPRNNPLDTDDIEERLLASTEGDFTDMSVTRRNPPKATILLTVPHALPAGDHVEMHWCDWSAAPAARQLHKLMKQKYDTILHLADKKRTEVDYNRIASAETRWQLELDGLLSKCDILVDVHSFPEDDVMWAGYDFVLFNSSEWPQQRQMEQANLQDHLVNEGYKVFMDIADHRNYIQEKGIKAGKPSFLVEFNENLKLKKPCSVLIEGLEELLLDVGNPLKMLLKDNPLRGTSAKYFDPNMLDGFFEPRKGGGYYQGYTAVWAASGETDESATVAFDYSTHGRGGYDNTPKDRVPLVHYISPTADMEKQYDGAVRYPNGFKAEDTIEVWRGQTFNDWASQRTGFFQKLSDRLGSITDNEFEWHKYQRYKREQRKSFDQAFRKWEKTFKAKNKEALLYQTGVKDNPVLPLKRHGYFPTTNYSTVIPGEEERHNEIQAFQKKHDNLVKSIMKKDFSKTWTWNSPIAESQKETEKKALKKAILKAERQLHEELCTRDNGKPCKNWYGRKKTKKIPKPAAWYEIEKEPEDCKVGSFKVCPTDCLFCYNEQHDVKRNPWKTGGPGERWPTGNWWEPDPRAKEIFESSPPLKLINRYINGKAEGMDYNKVFAAVAKYMKKQYNVTYRMIEPKKAKNILFLQDPDRHFFDGQNPGTYNEDAGIVFFNTEMLDMGEYRALQELGHETATVIASHMFGGRRKIPKVDGHGENSKKFLTHVIDVYTQEEFKTNPPVAPGMTRLWRGGKDNKYPLVPKGEEPKEWSPYAQWKFGGRYFTTDKEHAMSFAKRTDGIGGKGPAQPGEKVLMYIDIETKDLPKYHLPFILEKMRQQHQSFGYPSPLQYKSRFVSGKINPNELEYPIIGSGTSDAATDKAREIEYWIGPNIELYGKVKVHSRWTDNPPNTHVVISRSDKADKKLKAVFHKPNGRTKTTHFGGKHYSDYTIHNDRKRMERYNNRHRTNENWNKFMSAGALSKWILWNKPSLKGSFDDYLDRFGITGELKVKTSQAGEIKHGKKNPPTHELQSIPLVPSGETIATVEEVYSNPPVGFVGPKGRDWFVGDDGAEAHGLVREEVSASPKVTSFTNKMVGKESTIIPYCEYAGNVNLMKVKESTDEVCEQIVEYGRKSYDLPELDFIDEKGVKEDIISMYSIVISQHEAMHVETVGEMELPSVTGHPFRSMKKLHGKFLNAVSRLQDSKERMADLAAIETMESLGSLRILYTNGIVSEFKLVPGDPGHINWQNDFDVLKKNPVEFGYALPNPTPHFFPGEAVKKFPWLKHSNLINTNPPVFPSPERVSGKKGGKYLMDSGKDVTGLHFKKAEILGSDKSINIEWKNQVKKPEPKPAPKSGMRRVRFNMLRPSKFDGYDDSWIVASETSKGHIYSLRVKVHGVLTLKTFPKKKSEPRLRPETYGSIIAFNQIGEITIKSSGKKHPLYDVVYVSKTKENKGGGTSKRVKAITVKYVRTLHPQFDVFNAAALVKRLESRGLSKQAENRQMGRILTEMARDGLIHALPDRSYRNTEARYNEYLAEQEEARDNPRTPEGRKVPKRYLKGLNKTEKAIAKYEVDRGYKYDIDDPEAYEDWKSDIMAKARGMETAPSRFKLKFIKKYGPLPKGKDLVSRLAKATGIKKQYIQKAYDKGLAAWRGGHRPGTVQHQWASGRAYALVMGAPTSTGKGKPDFQLAVKAGVRDKNGKLLI